MPNIRLLIAMLVIGMGLMHANTVLASIDPIKDDLVMAFVPSRDTNTVQFSAKRIAKYLSRQTNYNIKAITVSNYASVIVGMSTKRIDLAFVGPLSYVVANKKNGAYPITSAVRDGEKGYHGIIITRKDSGIDTLKDLVGKTFAFGDVLSTSANLYPKAALIEAGIEPMKDMRSVTVSSHPAIVSAVLGKKVDAGAVYFDARTKPEILSKFSDILETTSILHKTELIPADPQIVRQTLHPMQVEKLTQALIALSDDEEGKLWLKELFNIDRLVLATDSEYNRLRKVILDVKPDILD